MIFHCIVGAAWQQLCNDCEGVGKGAQLSKAKRSRVLGRCLLLAMCMLMHTRQEHHVETMCDPGQEVQCTPPTATGAALTCPFVAMNSVTLNDDRILPVIKGLLLHLGIQLVAPPEPGRQASKGCKQSSQPNGHTSW